MTKKEFKNWKMFYQFVTENEPLKSWFNLETIERNYYREDWLYLMPIVEKIEELGFIVDIMGCACSIHQASGTIDGAIMIADVGGNYTNDYGEVIKNYPTKIEAVYVAVLIFLRWMKKIDQTRCSEDK